MNENIWTKITTSVLSESLVRAREAIAFLQMNQQQPIGVVVEDDEIRIYLDDYILSYPFDPSEPTEREVWIETLGGGQRGALCLGIDDLVGPVVRDLFQVEIDNVFSALGAYAYDAAAAAINYLTKEK